MNFADLKALVPAPGKGTDSSTTVGAWRSTAASASVRRVSSTRFRGPARAAASGSNVGWLPASDSA